MRLAEPAGLAIKYSEKLGVDEVEAFAQSVRTSEVVIERGEIQNERVKTQRGIGVRVIKKKRLGFAFTSVLSKESIEQMCRNADSLASVSPPNPDWVSLPAAAKLPKTPLGTFDADTADMKADDVLKLALKGYEGAKALDKRVAIDEGKFSVVCGEAAVANSHGVEAEGRGTLLYGYIICAAKDKSEVSSMTFEYDITRCLKDFSPERIGRVAAERAVASLGSKAVASFTGTALLDYDVASDILLQPLAASVNADNIQRGRSLWAGKLGEEVASEKLTAADDGLMPKGIGSSSFDAEGVPSQKTRVITDGELVGFLHNSFTANKEKRHSTGNAFREGYNVPPRISVSNLVVKVGKKRLDDLIAMVDKGIIVKRFSGNVHPDSGEFSGIAKQASYIEKGEVKYSLKETMISGNSFQALKNIIEIGSETRPTMFQAYTPPILVDKINVVSK